ncbi:MAG: type I methionyl aminopeptidase [Firmicutes bacterium]|nr:type I methionyl aminopeptidase [Bacillota bacterium]
MKSIKTYDKEKLDLLRQSGKILANTLNLLESNINPGITTMELNNIAEKHIIEQGGIPSFKDYNGFPCAICTSINEESIHGMPRVDKVLKDGDIISVDVGVRYNGLCTDAARTFPVGKISDDAKKLIEITKQSFYQAINGLKALSKVGDIGERIEDFVKSNSNFSIIDNFFGHGVGYNVHEEPLIPNFRPDRKAKKILKDVIRIRLPLHSVIAIEPMINQGTKTVKTGSDKWTVVTADGKLAAHYENTLIILEDGVEIVTE